MTPPAPVQFIVEVPASNVKFVIAEELQTVVAPDKFKVDEPSVKVLVLELLEDSIPIFTVWLFVFNVPEVKVIVLVEPIVSVSCKTTDPVVVPAIVIPPQVPEVVSEPIVRLMVAVAGGFNFKIPVHVIVPANKQTVVVAAVPATIISEAPDKVPVYPVILNEFKAAVASFTVQSPPEFASKITLLPATGFGAPPAPPE
jgi:hypothetical protein